RKAEHRFWPAQGCARQPRQSRRQRYRDIDPEPRDRDGCGKAEGELKKVTRVTKVTKMDWVMETTGFYQPTTTGPSPEPPKPICPHCGRCPHCGHPVGFQPL